MSHFLVTSWFNSVCIVAVTGLIFNKSVNLNMNYSFLTTMYEEDIRIFTVVMSHEADKATYHDNI